MTREDQATVHHMIQTAIAGLRADMIKRFTVVKETVEKPIKKAKFKTYSEKK
jgi:hypothetical protein